MGVIAVQPIIRVTAASSGSAMAAGVSPFSAVTVSSPNRAITATCRTAPTPAWNTGGRDPA
ncbi:hypothetical protein ACIBQX_42910 [Nonomuraea sp. NPDC049714]|uniref:hypothetical protein n=1 Tax=Nonomuraea sp. NPDC049714 TaxID=3364357 RepID=UPI0037A39472